MERKERFKNISLVFRIMNNSTNNTLDVSGFKWISEEARVIFGIIYGLIIIVGICGNVLVVLSVIKVPSMRTVTNIFIANLAVADLLVTTICCPLLLTHIISYPNWMLGNGMCYVISALLHISLTASSLGLFAISLDRYLAIAHAQRHVMTFRKVKIMLLITWFVAIAMSAPTFWLKPDTSAVTRSADVCLIVWRSSAETKKFEMIKGCSFAVVFMLIAYFYYKIAQILWRRKIPGNQTRENQEATFKTRKKVVKLLIIVLLCFLGCWAPMLIYRILRMNLSVRQFHPPKEVYTGTTILMMTNSAMNPVLYALFNRNFRTAFKNVYRKFVRTHVVPLPDAFSVAMTTNQSLGFRSRRRKIGLSDLVPRSNRISAV